MINQTFVGHHVIVERFGTAQLILHHFRFSAQWLVDNPVGFRLYLFEPGLGFGHDILVIFVFAADIAHLVRQFVGSLHQRLKRKRFLENYLNKKKFDNYLEFSCDFGHFGFDQ